MDGRRRRQVGTGAERAAAEYLAGLGYRVVALDVRLPSGQVDLVAMDGDCLVIVEVKARTGHAFGFPVEAVDFRKRRRLRVLAAEFLQANPGTGQGLRVDVVGVDLDQAGHPRDFTHYPGIG